MAQLIHVKLGPKGLTVPGRPGATRIFHENDAAHIEAGHPDGEALVVAGRVVKVAYTPAIRQALASEILVETSDPATPQPPDISETLEERGALDAATPPPTATLSAGGEGKAAKK